MMLNTFCLPFLFNSYDFCRSKTVLSLGLISSDTLRPETSHTVRASNGNCSYFGSCNDLFSKNEYLKSRDNVVSICNQVGMLKSRTLNDDDHDDDYVVILLSPCCHCYLICF